jgi:hypothetical protein
MTFEKRQNTNLDGILLSIGGLWFITPSEVVGFDDKNIQSPNTWGTPRL